MKTKTAYRPKNNIPAETPAPSVPVDDERIQPSESVKISFDINGAEPVEAAVEPATDTDEATAALLRQLQHLQASEQAQREFATQVAAQRMAQQHAQRPMTREEKLELWKGQGMDDHEAEFLREHPDLIDRPEITQQAAAAALHAGLERGTHDFNNAVKLNFDTMLGRIEAQAQPAPASTPEFFRPPRQPVSEPAGPASYVSAPVSRTAPSGYREPTSPRSVRLSPIEQEIARNLGLSDTAYAAGKIRLQKAKANGELQ